MPMTDITKRNLIAQWAFDTRPVLLRFHLWLEDVEVERSQSEPVSAHTFAPRGIARCLAMTSAATALGTRLFGDYGAGAGQDKTAVNQVKKAAETPEMGANPMLGFGRVYARAELAKTVDRRVRRLLNEPGHTFEQFHEWLQGRGITLWGAAVDTLENTSRFADGRRGRWRFSTSSTRRCGCRGRTSRTWAVSPCPRRWPKPPRTPRCSSTTAPPAR